MVESLHLGVYTRGGWMAHARFGFTASVLVISVLPNVFTPVTFVGSVPGSRCSLRWKAGVFRYCLRYAPENTGPACPWRSAGIAAICFSDCREPSFRPDRHLDRVVGRCF